MGEREGSNSPLLPEIIPKSHELSQNIFLLLLTKSLKVFTVSPQLPINIQAYSLKFLTRNESGILAVSSRNANQKSLLAKKELN